jgi:hypothetical protein
MKVRERDMRWVSWVVLWWWRWWWGMAGQFCSAGFWGPIADPVMFSAGRGEAWNSLENRVFGNF